jgi:hypothetical protein
MSIRHSIHPRKGSKNWQLEYWEPITGERHTESLRTSNENEARLKAGKRLAEIEAGVTVDRRKSWADFCTEFTELRMAPKRKSTRGKMASTLKAVTELINPNRIALLENPLLVAKFAMKLRDRMLTEATVKSHLSCLRTALNWACRMGYIGRVPHIEIPERTEKRKGRDPTREEFDRFLMKIPDEVGRFTAVSEIHKRSKVVIKMRSSGDFAREISVNSDLNRHFHQHLPVSGQVVSHRLQALLPRLAAYRVAGFKAGDLFAIRGDCNVVDGAAD